MKDSLVCSVSQSLFNFNAEHNGICCIQKTDSERPCDKIWFTEAQICEWSGMCHSTMYRRLKLLEDKGRISRCSDLNNVDVPTETGAVKTTIYNLNVLNQLAMICIESDVLNETSKKFSDILSEVETTGSYCSVKVSRKDQLYLTLIHAESEAVRVSALTELNEINKQEIKAIESERDEAVRTKALIGSKREATAMAKASAKTRECERLTVENESLKDAVGRGSNWRTVSMMKAEWIREFGHAPAWQKLKQFSADVHIDPVRDVEEKVILPDGSSKTCISFRYHREAWARYRKYEENLRVTDLEIENV